MKKDQIKIGGTYLAKVTDKVVPVRLDKENPHGGWDATNLATNKKVRIKSAAKLRGPAPDEKAGPQPSRNDEPEPAKVKTSNATPKPTRARKPSGLDAAARVLKNANEPMRCKDIVQRMLDQGLWSTSGATPHATIYAAILREITTKGPDARFRKTDRGMFTLNA